jgi:hypothetical protein
MRLPRPQVVGTSLRDIHLDEIADRQRAGDEDKPVHLRGVPARPTDRDRLGPSRFVLGLTLSLDQDLDLPADQCSVLPQGDRLLRLHDGIAPLLRHRRWDRHRIQRYRLGARFR